MNPRRLSLWYAENLEGRLLPALGVGGAVVLGVLYAFDALPERVAGVLLALAVVLASTGYGVVALSRSAGGRVDFAVAWAVGVLSVLLAVAMVWVSLVPREPLAQGELLARGDALVLPAASSGPVRLLLRGRPAGGSAANVEVVLQVGEERVRGHLSRTVSAARVGRRGSASVTQEHNAEFLDVDVPAGVDRVTLAELHGALAGPLRLEVVPGLLSLPTEMLLAGALVIAAAVVAGRSPQKSAGVGGVACALVFGVIVNQMATPFAAVRPEIGALVVGLVGGGLGGAVLAWMFGKLLRPRPRGANA